MFDLKVISDNQTFVEFDWIVDPTTPPDMKFVAPTPANDTTTSNTSIEINVSITNETDIDTIIYNWNGTNFTLFNDSVVLLMNFDNQSNLGESYNNSNGSVIIDISSYSNNGTLYTGADDDINYSIGKYQNAFNFDGADDFIIVNGSGLNITNELTISAWVNLDQVTNKTMRIVTKAGLNETDLIQNASDNDITFFGKNGSDRSGRSVISFILVKFCSKVTRTYSLLLIGSLHTSSCSLTSS